MAKKEEVFYSPCVKCKRETRHKTVVETVTQGDSEYQFYESHGVIECQGCEKRAFRYFFRDIEQAYPISDSEWECPETIEYYPKYNPAHVEIDHIARIPDIVGEIYLESMLAVQAGALTLAGLGLRGTIEAVCNDREIKGRDLASRITKMATQGLISNKDAARLHAIRFLGNDAAHDIKKPSEMQMSVAIKIINHLIQSVYLLELEMARKLDTIIDAPAEFEKLLDKHVAEFSAGDEFPLAKFLGKDIRRLGDGASKLEAHLLAKIADGSYTKLSVGKVDKHAGSKNDFQHFVVA